MNLILTESEYVAVYTFLDNVLSTVHEFTDCWWLISDIELNHYPDPILMKEPVLISGHSLVSIIGGKDVQFIWAVLSGFRDKPENIPDELPFADGNPSFWVAKPRPQLRGAQFEIVCWDSSCTLFIGMTEEISRKLKELFPDISDLDEYNREQARRPKKKG